MSAAARRGPWLLLLMLCGAPPLSGDILHLRDGSRYYGTLISEDDDALVFKITLADGRSGLVKRFLREDVSGVERSAERSAPPTEPGSPQTTSALDFIQVLREALELLDDGDDPAALRAMQLIATRAAAEELRRVEAECLRLRRRPLTDLLAEARYWTSLSEGGGRQFRLRYVTPYEAAALGRLLAARTAALLEQTYDGRRLRDWAGARREYHRVQTDSRSLAADAGLAVALLTARLRFDPALKGASPARQELVELRDELSRLSAHVLALPGFTAPGVPAGGPPAR